MHKYKDHDATSHKNPHEKRLYSYNDPEDDCDYIYGDFEINTGLPCSNEVGSIRGSLRNELANRRRGELKEGLRWYEKFV